MRSQAGVLGRISSKLGSADRTIPVDSMKAAAIITTRLTAFIIIQSSLNCTRGYTCQSPSNSTTMLTCCLRPFPKLFNKGNENSNVLQPNVTTSGGHSRRSNLKPQVLEAIDSVYTIQVVYWYGLTASLAPPWLQWNSEEEKEFIHRFKDWEQNNSSDDTEMSIKGVLEKIRSGVARFGDSAVKSDLAQELWNIIPNDPFPVRSVIVGLISVAVYAAVSLSKCSLEVLI